MVNYIGTYVLTDNRVACEVLYKYNCKNDHFLASHENRHIENENNVKAKIIVTLTLFEICEVPQVAKIQPHLHFDYMLRRKVFHVLNKASNASR